MAKILLAEDDKFICHAYKDGMERADFKVVVATDGEEAVAQAKKVKPDIILLDLMMPIKDGFEVLADLKKDKKLARIPVIILSNLSQDSDRQRCQTLGANDYLVKSDYTMQEVIAKVKSYLPS